MTSPRSVNPRSPPCDEVFRGRRNTRNRRLHFTCCILDENLRPLPSVSTWDFDFTSSVIQCSVWARQVTCIYFVLNDLIDLPAFKIYGAASVTKSKTSSCRIPSGHSRNIDLPMRLKIVEWLKYSSTSIVSRNTSPDPSVSKIPMIIFAT
jgi:hypothetical protein